MNGFGKGSSSVLGGLVSAVIVLSGLTGGWSEATAAERERVEAKDAVQDPASAGAEFMWYRMDDRTPDGQQVIPWRRYVASWQVTCEKWYRDEVRRLIIFTAFEPDSLLVETPKDGGGKDEWSIDKWYAIDPRDLHLYGDRKKSLVVHVNVGQWRPKALIPHEEECFRRMAGLPAVLLEGKSSGAKPVRYAMTVDEATFERQPTISRAGTENAVRGYQYIGTVKLTETYWSFAQREWLWLLGQLAVFIAVLDVARRGALALLHWYRRRPKQAKDGTSGRTRCSGGNSEAGASLDD